jgi:hypothetical protein
LELANSLLVSFCELFGRHQIEHGLLVGKAMREITRFIPAGIKP